MAYRSSLVAASIALTLTLSLCVARTAAAQDAPARLGLSRAIVLPSASTAISASTPRVTFDVRANARPDGAAGSIERPHGSVFLTSLYATTALVQGMDAHSTLKAINAGARERNPLMAVLTSHPPAFVALKAGAATGLILAARRVAKHNKVHAAIALIAIDSAYAYIAIHNYQVAARLR